MDGRSGTTRRSNATSSRWTASSPSPNIGFGRGGSRFTHTEVPDALEGRGIGKRLVKAALDDARAQGLKVVPVCPFVKHYIENHPETQDLLA